MLNAEVKAPDFAFPKKVATDSEKNLKTAIKNGDEQGGEGKINAGEVHGQLSCQGAQDGAHHPIALVQHGNQEKIPVPVQVLRRPLGDQGKGLVSEGKNQVGLFLPGAFVGIHHGDAVKEVAGVDHQCGQSGGGQTDAAGEQADAHILHGAGVNEKAHCQCPQYTVAVFLQNDSKAKAQEEIPRHHGNGV